MGDNKFILLACLFVGLVIYNGLRGIGWLAHMFVPGLALGLVFYVAILGVRWMRQ